MRREWLTTEEKKLRELFPVYKTKDVAKVLGRSYGSISDKAHLLGLTKKFDFIDRWLPGQKPKHAKKGQHSPGCEKTWFKTGNNARSFPIGSETMRWGSLLVKVTDYPCPDGNTRQKMMTNWKRKKDLVWVENFGPIPEGHLVTMKDGDKRNCAPENLALVTRAHLSKYAKRNVEKWRASMGKIWAARKEAHA